MIKILRYNDLGNKDYDWLKARYHFSFGEYNNPNRIRFGKMRVINDDIVSPGKGFAPHDHDNMEIITYVRSGAITHEDSTGNKGRTAAGHVQVMSAGSGITHAEYNHEDTETTLYQIWIFPRSRNTRPRWNSMTFPTAPVNTALNLLVSGDEHDSALYIDADAKIYGGRLEKGTTLIHPLDKDAYILASDGTFTVNGEAMHKGDGAEVTGTNSLEIKALEDSEIVIIELDA